MHERHLWVIFMPYRVYDEDEVKAIFATEFGREPDRIHSPEESKTKFWWMGWVTRPESLQWVAQNEAAAQS